MPEYTPHGYGSSFPVMVQWLSEPSNPFGDLFEEYQEEWFDDSINALLTAVGENRRDLIDRVELVCLEAFLARDDEELGNACEAFQEMHPGLLSADETRYQNAIIDTAPSFYEIRDVVPKSHLVLADMVRKTPPVTVMEYSATKSLVKGAAIFGRVLKMDGIYILSGALLEFPPGKRLDVLDSIERMTKSMRRQIPKKRRKDKFTRSLVQELALESAAPLVTALWVRNIEEAVLPPVVRNTDDHAIVLIEDRYEITGKIEDLVIALDDDEENLKCGNSRWDWFGEPVGDPEGKYVRGSLAIESGALRTNVNSQERAERLRDRVATRLGGLIGKRSSTETSMAEAMEKGKPEGPREPQFSPEEQVAVDAHLAKLQKDHYTKCLDVPIPMLDNHTPRELAASPDGRTQVIEWLRYLEYMPNPAQDFDFGWMWEELGLAEHR